LGKNCFYVAPCRSRVDCHTVLKTYATQHQFYGLYFIPSFALLAAWGISRLRSAWQAIAVFLVFVVSSLWYASNLFAHQSFAPDDFTMLKRANAAVPSSTPICMGENTEDNQIKFYIFPRQIDNSPCPMILISCCAGPKAMRQKIRLPLFLQTFSPATFGRICTE